MTTTAKAIPEIPRCLADYDGDLILVPRDAVQAVVDYLWEDERKDIFCFRAGDDRDDHIFQSVWKLNCVLDDCEDLELLLDDDE